MRLPERIVSYDPPRKMALLLLGLCLFCAGCRSFRSSRTPTVTLGTLPAAGPGGRTEVAVIAGTVSGAKPGQQIVIYTRTDQWYVQPLEVKPFTTIDSNGHWEASIHLGLEYAALLVDPEYQPLPKIARLPQTGGGVVAMAYAGPDRVGKLPAPKILHFSGYDWTSRKMENPRNGAWNVYEPDNVWTDANGALHLRLTHRSGKWTCAEAVLTRSLGYGTYRFTVHDVTPIGTIPAFSTFTYDDRATAENNREVAIELSRWGKPGNKNAQFVLQPYYLSENVARFMAPPGVVINSFHWEPGRVSFTSQSVPHPGATPVPIAEHVFTSGIPEPGNETVHINLSIPTGHLGEPDETEVILDRFEYLP